MSPTEFLQNLSFMVITIKSFIKTSAITKCMFSSLNTAKQYPHFFHTALARWLSWRDRHPMHQKVVGSITGRGTYLGLGLDFYQGAYGRQSINVSLCLSLPPSLKINDKYTSGWGLKLKNFKWQQLLKTWRYALNSSFSPFPTGFKLYLRKTVAVRWDPSPLVTPSLLPILNKFICFSTLLQLSVVHCLPVSLAGAPILFCLLRDPALHLHF